MTPIHIVKWSADDRRLISVARDQSMRVWSLETGRTDMNFEHVPDDGILLTAKDGRLIGGSRRQIRDGLKFLIERPNGACELIDYTEFIKRTGQNE